MPSIKEILTAHTEHPSKLLDVLCVDTNDEREPEEFREEYEGERTRRTKSVGNRENKVIDVLDDDGVKTGEKTVYVSKLVFPFPRKVVRTATHFLFGGKMSISSDENTDAIKEFSGVWEKDLKMQTALKKLARTCMIETKAAMIFYPQQEADETEVEIDGKVETKKEIKGLKLRVRVLDNDSGEFFPHFDDYGDMDAFTRKFSTTDIEGKDVQRAIIYTKDMIIHMVDESGWNHDKAVVNRFGKIPVVYVEQDEPEWESVATLIDDFEMRISRLADTNDYFAEPLLKLFGDVEKAPGKDEVGKMVQFKMKEDLDGKISHGDAEYATWDQTPESVKLELETVNDGIFSMTSTPDLSFNNIKGIGTVSGIALKLMFLDALIKREEKGEIFFDALNRAISVVIAGIAGMTNIKLEGQLEKDNVRVNFTDQLPEDMAAAIDTLVIATGGKPILSQESAASISPYPVDAKEEVERLKSEQAAATKPDESFQM